VRRQKAKGKRQKAKGKRQKAKGKRNLGGLGRLSINERAVTKKNEAKPS
jgi:hypothetical protein